MKTRTKRRIANMLRNAGLWHYARTLTAITRGEERQWINGGCQSPPPHGVKVKIVKAHLKKFGITNFVETGTYLGDTLESIAKTGARCLSIELDTELYGSACRRFSGWKNVKLMQGNSGELMHEVTKSLNEPTLFWLDGHYSGGVTAQGDKDTPISEELSAILGHHVKGHVILVDDARCFNGMGDYPNLDKLIEQFNQHNHYRCEVSCDMIRITPIC